MAKLPDDFNWHRSIAHLHLLKWFLYPRDPEDAPPFYNEGLREPLSATVNRFLQDGAIRTCTVAEKMVYLYKVTDLRPRLRVHNLKAGGTKEEMIRRLLDVESERLEEETTSHRMFICTEFGEKIIANYEQEKKVALENAQIAVFQHLVAMEILEAKKDYLDYLRDWDPPRVEYSNEYKFQDLRRIIEKTPKRLANQHDENTLRILHAAVAMEKFWSKVPVWNWLGEDFPLDTEAIDQAVKLIDRYHDYLGLLERSFQQYVIWFGEDNPNVCENCLKLVGQKLNTKNPLDWPFEGCTNPIGCLPVSSYSAQFEDDDVEEVDEGDLYEKMNEEEEELLDINELETPDDLKADLAQDLIDDDEFDVDEFLENIEEDEEEDLDTGSLTNSTDIDETDPEIQKKSAEANAEVEEFFYQLKYKTQLRLFVETLRHLHIMLKHGLITEADYEKKKSEVLDRF